MRRIAWAVGLAACLWSANVRADPQVDAARKLGQEALVAFEQGRWELAYDKFAQAHEKLRAPTLMLFMARCQRNRGKLVQARGHYEAVVREPLPARPSAPFVKAKKDAAEELEGLNRRIPSLKIQVSGPLIADVAVRIDDVVVPPSDLGRAVPIDPGAHRVRITASGYQPHARDVVLPERAEVTDVDVALSALAAGGGPDEGESSVDGPAWPGALALGVGGAGLVIGAVAGGIALARADSVRSQCIDGHCPPESEADADSARTLSTVSTVGLIAGGALAATGVVLLISRPGGAETSLRIGPTWAGVVTGF